MKLRKLATLALAAVAFTACSDDSTEPVEQIRYEYQLTVSGGVSASLTGPAVFGADTDFGGDSIFAVLLGQDTSKHTILLARRGTQRPAIGTYSISDVDTEGNPWMGLYIVSEDGEVADLYFSEQGTITITESTPQRVKGTVDFTANALEIGLPTTPVQVRITGSFVAKPATAPVLQLQ